MVVVKKKMKLDGTYENEAGIRSADENEDRWWMVAVKKTRMKE